ncbi:hypothetical protein GSI_14027 [Ganoderma sinense ZZ0214-1]|uniref:CSN8/PSMD8/EIF3K domain-containing protein n=1 Tax=Ganoderma sinense ZZ0214-1 TaxID=1077348 RepID=A0A2G8RRY2_9APHY|nr:hypothetical protein GSI_14027 [Ganoderma sinense ZZ0214-1]
MTGPPTPPPSSATEIQDAARTSVPPQAAKAAATDPAAPDAQPAPEQVQAAANVLSTANKTSYELIFPSLVILARSGTTKELIQMAERADLNGSDGLDQTRLFVVAPLVLAYLIADEITPARSALARLPNALSGLPITQAFFSLLASVSERKYTQIYSRAQALRDMVSQPDFPDAELGQLLVGLIDAFVEAFRKKTFALLARAYTSLPLALAQTYLGLTAEEVVNGAVPAGWAFHETTYILTPPKQSPFSARRAVDATPSTLSALSLVAESVANLDA